MICSIDVLVLQELIKNSLSCIKLWVVGKMCRIAEQVFPRYLTVTTNRETITVARSDTNISTIRKHRRTTECKIRLTIN